MNRLKIMVALATMLAAPVAYAGTDSPMIVASIASPAPHFMPLDSARSGIAGVRVQRPVSQATRSDRDALNNGFMRMDRARLAPVRMQRALITPAKAEPVRVLKPQDTAVLDLFGDDSAVPEAAPALTNFGRVAHAWPMAKTISQRLSSMFGMRKDPFSGKQAFHGGIDIAAATGTPVLASADGTVSKVEKGGRLGNYVSVQHRDGSESSYGHLSAQSVRVGQHVRQGQQLGAVGSTGRSTGPHLDYRLRKNGELVNPMSALRQPTEPAPSRMASSINGVQIIR